MNRLKALREERGMKQSELGKLLNVKDAAISKYESGKIPLTGDTLIALSEIFAVSIDYILGNDNYVLGESEQEWQYPVTQNRFGSLLIQYRKKKSLSAKALAKALNISVEFESELEIGMHTPSMPLLKKIADITGYGIDFLIGSTNNVSVPTNKTFEISGISFPISEFEFDYTFRSRFEKLCIQHNITSENSLEMLSIPRTDFTEIKYNRFPTLPELLRIAYAFDVSMDYLIGKTDTPFSGLSKDELHLILNYRDCIEPYKQNIQERAEKLCNESLTHTPIATDEQLKKTGTDHTGK